MSLKNCFSHQMKTVKFSVSAANAEQDILNSNLVSLARSLAAIIIQTVGIRVRLLLLVKVMTMGKNWMVINY